MDNNIDKKLKDILFDLYSIFYHLERIRNYHKEPNWWAEQETARMFGRINHAQAFVRSIYAKLDLDPDKVVIDAMEHAAWSSYFGTLLNDEEKAALLAERLKDTQGLIPHDKQK